MSFVSAPSKIGPSPAKASQPEIFLSACLEGGIPLPAQLLELARVDLTFLTDRPLRFGTPVQIAIFSDFVSSVAQHKAIVHWCRPHARGWHVGAFLTQPLPDRLTSHEWNDLRSTLRYDCTWKAWALWAETGVLESVQIQNYSITGLRLVKDTAVLPEMEFSLFGSAGRRDRAVVKGKVQWCRPVEGCFHVGALIHGQKGRDLPRIFGNLDAVHVDSSQPDDIHSGESQETLRCEQELMERFLPSEGSIALREETASRRLDNRGSVGNS